MDHFLKVSKPENDVLMTFGGDRCREKVGRAVETVKTAVETGLSQQLPKTGVETAQQLLSLSVNTVRPNTVSTLNPRPCQGIAL